MLKCFFHTKYHPFDNHSCVTLLNCVPRSSFQKLFVIEIHIGRWCMYQCNFETSLWNFFSHQGSEDIYHLLLHLRRVNTLGAIYSTMVCVLSKLQFLSGRGTTEASSKLRLFSSIIEHN